MHRQHQHVLLGVKPQQRDAQQPVMGEIEPLLQDGARPLAGLIRLDRERLSGSADLVERAFRQPLSDISARHCCMTIIHQYR
jgi:hypothetical protein